MYIVVRLLVAGFTGLSVILAILSAIEKCGAHPVVGLVGFVVSAVVIACACFVVNGFWLEGFLVRKAVLEFKNIGMRICVKKGNLFSQKGVIVVAVNDFFDTVVDDQHINGSSVHGLMIRKYWKDGVLELDHQICQQLSVYRYVYEKRDGVVKERRYPIGTSILVKDSKGHRFILVALSRTDADTHCTQAVLSDLRSAIRGSLALAREVANGDDVSFAIMGSGNARIKAPRQVLLNTLISEIISECLENQKVSNVVNVVIKGKMLRKLNLHAFEAEWAI